MAGCCGLCNNLRNFCFQRSCSDYLFDAIQSWKKKKKGGRTFSVILCKYYYAAQSRRRRKTKNIICLFFFLFKCCKRKRERKMLDGPFLIFPCERLFWHRDPSPPDAKLPSALFFLFCADLSIDIYIVSGEGGESELFRCRSIHQLCSDGPRWIAFATERKSRASGAEMKLTIRFSFCSARHSSSVPLSASDQRSSGDCQSFFSRLWRSSRRSIGQTYNLSRTRIGGIGNWIDLTSASVNYNPLQLSLFLYFLKKSFLASGRRDASQGYHLTNTGTFSLIYFSACVECAGAWKIVSVISRRVVSKSIADPWNVKWTTTTTWKK